jgi:hypothetical protein
LPGDRRVAPSHYFMDSHILPSCSLCIRSGCYCIIFRIRVSPFLTHFNAPPQSTARYYMANNERLYLTTATPHLRNAFHGYVWLDQGCDLKPYHSVYSQVIRGENHENT